MTLKLRVARAFCCGSLLIVFLSGGLLLSSCKQQIPLIEQKCGTCHSADIVYQTRRTAAGWRQTMHGMKLRGMVISAEEEEQVFTILLRDFLLE